MISKRTEKAIRAWLDLDESLRDGAVIKGSVRLWDRFHLETIAEFTLASVIAKRYPKRKKKKAP